MNSDPAPQTSPTNLPAAPLPPTSGSAGPPAFERPTNIRWLMFALACGTSWFMYLHRYTWNMVGPELMKEYNWSNTEMQTAYLLFNTTYGVGQLPSGVLCDFFGPHLFLGIIIILWSLVIALFGLRLTFAQIGGLRLVFGIAQAGGYPILAKVTQAWFPPSYRTQIQGWVATFFGRTGGAMSSILMATVLMHHYQLSWQMSLVVLSAAGVLFGIVFLLLFRNSPDADPRVNAAERAHIHEGAAAVVPGDRRVMPWGTAIRNRSMLFFVTQQMLVAGADTVFGSLMGAYFLSKGVDVKSAGWAVSLPLWGGAVGGILGGMLNDALLRGQRKRLIWLGFAAGSILATCRSGIEVVVGGVGQEWGNAGNIVEILGKGLLDVGGYTLAGGIVGSLATCLLMPAAGSRRWGRSSIGFGGNVLACLLILVTTRQESILAIGIALFTVKFFADMSQPTQWGACTDIGGRFSATVFAIINTAGILGGVIFPLIFGKVLDYCTTRTIVNGIEVKATDYNPMFLVIAGMYVTGGLCWLLIDCTRSVDKAIDAPRGA